MHGSRGQMKGGGKQGHGHGHNLLLTVACPDDEFTATYNKNTRSCNQPYYQEGIRKNSNVSYSSSSCPKHSWEWEGRRPRSRTLDEDDSLFAVSLPSQSHARKLPNSNKGPSVRRKLMYRCFQVFSILMVGISLYALVDNINYLIQTYDGDPDGFQSHEEIEPPNIHEELQSWVIDGADLSTKLKPTSPTPAERSQTTLAQPRKRETFNIKNLSFIINNASICKPYAKSGKDHLGDGVYFMIIIHSAPEHFEARQAIRSTWGSIKTLKNLSLRLAFLTGKVETGVEDGNLIESSILRESEIFGDIIAGSFVDTYKNLTYKHLMGYKWALEYCPESTFILKADDDAFIDIFQLFDFISRTYGDKPSQGTLICNVFPEGSKPVRDSDLKGAKWAVSKDEYPHSIYPKYCGGLSYLATPDVIQRILDVSDKVRFFWIDDVFVTGVLRELAGIEPFYLNLRYSYEPDKYRRWLSLKESSFVNTSHVLSVHKLSKFPFMITHVERGNLSEEMSQLWRKTLRAWSTDGENSNNAQR